jgi:iron complex outermembrane receptor protein
VYAHRSVAALLALCLLLSRSAIGQTGVSGTLIDATSGAPMAGATVEIHAPAVDTVRRATSDGRGRFRVEDLAPATYWLVVTAIGYAPRRLDGIVVPDSAAALRILLERLTLLDEQVVTPDRGAGSSLSAPTSLSVIARDAIERTPVLGGPIERLEGTSGLDVAQRSIQQRTFSARGPSGVNSSALLVLSDFRPVSLPFTRFNIPVLIPASDDNLDRIEVVRGPGSALYGPDADRGVVHFITSSPLDRQGTTLTLAAGGRSLGQAALGHSHRFGSRLGLRLSGEYLTARDWTAVDPTDAAPRDEQLQRTGSEARVDWQAGASTRLSVAAGLADAVRMVDQSDPGAIQLRHWRATFVQTRIEDGRLFGNLYLNANSSGDSFQLISGIRVVDESRALGGQLQHGSAVGRHVDLRYGVDLQRIVPRTGGTLDGRNEGDDGITQLGAYLSLLARVASRLDLVTAFRADHHNRLHDLVGSPRIGMVFRPAPAHAVRLIYNRATSTPVASDLFVDLALGRRIPGLPYEFRAEGTARPRGFDRSCGGLGGLCMHTPFAATAALPADATLLWSVVTAAVPGTAAVPAPSSGDIASRLAVLSLDRQGFVPVAPSEVTNIVRAQRSFADAIEIGYRGRLTRGVTASVEVARTHLTNIGSSLTIQTPNVFLDSAGTADFLMAHGKSAAEARALAGAVAGIPLGVVTPTDAVDPSAILLLPRQGGTADFWNVDAELVAVVSAWLSVAGTYSWASRDLFRRSAGLADVALNAPRNKGAVAVAVQEPRSGVTLDVRARWVSSFPVRAGIYVGTVETYGVADLSLMAPLPWRQGVTIGIAATNLFDNRHREFVGAAEIGRLVVTRVRAVF